MKTKFTVFFLSLSLVLSPLASAPASAGSCQQQCDTFNSAFDQLNSPACQNNEACKKCGSGVNSITRPNCMAQDVTKDANKAQDILLAVFGVATVVCGVACAAENGCVWCSWANGICPYMPFATFGAEMVHIAASKNKLDQKIMQMGMASGVAAGSLDKFKVKSEQSACKSTATLGLQTAFKAAFRPKVSSSIESGVCSNINDLQSQNQSLTSCLAKFDLPPPPPRVAGSGYNWVVSGSGELNPNVQALVGSDSLGGETLTAVVGNFSKLPPEYSFDKLAEKLKNAGSPGALLAELNSGTAALGKDMQDIEKMVAAGEPSKAIDLLRGSTGTQIASAALTAGGSAGFGSDEIGFGSTVTPGEGGSGVDEISIQGRSPALVSGAGEDGDIFHAGYPGTIFQIISKKLADNHPRLEQLEPVLPLNRALSGLKNPPAKKTN